MRFRLVPEHCRGNVILQRQITSPASPAECLDGNFQIFIESNRIGNMPAIQSKSLGNLVMTISFYYLAKAGIGRGECSIVRFIYSCGIFLPGIEIVRATEIILRPGSVYSREFCVAIHVEFNLTFAPPAVVMDTPGKVS